MGRGGRREGAGRPPMLSPEIAAAIRRDCEGRANVLREQQALNRHKRKMEKRGVVRIEKGRNGKERDPKHKVPPAERPTVIRFGSDEPENKNLPENLSEDARYTIDFMRTNRRWFGVYSEPLPGLAPVRLDISDRSARCALGISGKWPVTWGRSDIIKEVAKDWGVSERTVRSIWESKLSV